MIEPPRFYYLTNPIPIEKTVLEGVGRAGPALEARGPEERHRPAAPSHSPVTTASNLQHHLQGAEKGAVLRGSHRGGRFTREIACPEEVFSGSGFGVMGGSSWDVLVVTSFETTSNTCCSSSREVWRMDFLSF